MPYNILQVPTVEIPQTRYEQLIKAEQKATQYKCELRKFGEFEYLIDTIEANELAELCTENIDIKLNKEEN